jgi:hypothetical protein
MENLESHKKYLQIESDINSHKTNQIKLDDDVLSNRECYVYSDYSFENFIKMYQEANIGMTASWNKAREYFLREKKDRRRVILKEINQFDFKVDLIMFILIGPFENT